MIIEEEVEADSRLSGDHRTSEVIQTVANSISTFINMTVDCPSLNQDDWMPILDLKVRVRNNPQSS